MLPNFNTLVNHKDYEMRKIHCFFILIVFILVGSCHTKITEIKDQIYSRHLQKHISISIVSTPVPKSRDDFNLLILNDGKLIKELDIKNVVDTYYNRKLIKPVIVVGVDAFNPQEEFGVAGFTQPGKGTLAEKYNHFIVNELLPFIKKKSGVRKFNSITIAGSGLSGISAFDIAWDNWQVFDNVGFFNEFNNSASSSDFSLLAKKISQSRKRPRLRFWLCVNDSTGMERMFDVLDKKGIGGVTRVGGVIEENPSISSFESIFPFLIWIGQVY